MSALSATRVRVMSDLPIRAEAVEAAHAAFWDEHSLPVKSTERIKSSIAAFLETEDLTMERRDARDLSIQRLRGPWRDRKHK